MSEETKARRRMPCWRDLLEDRCGFQQHSDVDWKENASEKGVGARSRSGLNPLSSFDFVGEMVMSHNIPYITRFYPIPPIIRHSELEYRCSIQVSASCIFPVRSLFSFRAETSASSTEISLRLTLRQREREEIIRL